MRISRKYKVDDWKQLKFHSEEDWDSAVSMFEDRIESRYLEHIRVLLPRQTSQFAVLSLDSALIETLEQFRRGKVSTPTGEGADYFIAFLTETPEFTPHFDEHKARLFYKTIRCGLLHQAEAGGTSRVQSKGVPLANYSSDNKGIIINVRRFHGALESYINTYAKMLREPTSIDARAAFKKKMNAICRVEGVS